MSTITTSSQVTADRYWSLCAEIALHVVGSGNTAALTAAGHVALWLAEMRTRLFNARNIETPWHRLTDLYRELLFAGFEGRHRPQAEMWILRGDWQFKTPKMLTLPDFFPTATQMQACGETMMLTTQHAALLQVAVKRAYTDGINQGRQQERSSGTPSHTHSDDEAWKEERRRHHAEIMAEISQKERYIERIRQLEADNDTLSKRLAFERLGYTTAEIL